MSGERKVRSFIAVVLPARLKSKLSDVVESLKEAKGRIKCVKPENAHLTLRFLGYPGESKLKEVEAVIERAAEGTRPFRISLEGVGVFPSRSRPRVIWVGVRTGARSLYSLQEKIEQGLNALGFVREKRPYHAHITLGRVKSLPADADLEGWLRLNADVEVGETEVSGVTLMESCLKREGPEYTVLRDVAF